MGSRNDGGVVRARLGEFAREGIDEVQVWLAPNSPAEVEEFAPVLERLDRA